MTSSRSFFLHSHQAWIYTHLWTKVAPPSLIHPSFFHWRSKYDDDLSSLLLTTHYFFFIVIVVSLGCLIFMMQIFFHLPPSLSLSLSPLLLRPYEEKNRRRKKESKIRIRSTLRIKKILVYYNTYVKQEKGTITSRFFFTCISESEKVIMALVKQYLIPISVSNALN